MDPNPTDERIEALRAELKQLRVDFLDQWVPSRLEDAPPWLDPLALVTLGTRLIGAAEKVTQLRALIAQRWEEQEAEFRDHPNRRALCPPHPG